MEWQVDKVRMSEVWFATHNIYKLQIYTTSNTYRSINFTNINGENTIPSGPGLMPEEFDLLAISSFSLDFEECNFDFSLIDIFNFSINSFRWAMLFIFADFAAKKNADNVRLSKEVNYNVIGMATRVITLSSTQLKCFYKAKQLLAVFSDLPFSFLGKTGGLGTLCWDRAWEETWKCTIEILTKTF